MVLFRGYRRRKDLKRRLQKLARKRDELSALHSQVIAEYVAAGETPPDDFADEERNLYYYQRELDDDELRLRAMHWNIKIDSHELVHEDEYTFVPTDVRRRVSKQIWDARRGYWMTWLSHLKLFLNLIAFIAGVLLSDFVRALWDSILRLGR